MMSNNLNSNTFTVNNSPDMTNNLTGNMVFSEKSSSKTEMTNEEIISALNIPPRDEVKYPSISNEDQLTAGSFLSRLNLLAASYDLNLQSLVWNLYKDLSNYLRSDIEGNEEQIVSLFNAINRLKLYLKESNNPIFNDPPQTDDIHSDEDVKEQK